VDDHQDIKQVLFAAKPTHEDKIFEFCHSQAIEDENSPAVRATSL
jgi:hypothetical protein